MSMPQAATAAAISRDWITIDSQSDVLGCCFVSNFKSGQIIFRSIEHYCQYAVLMHLNLRTDAQKLLDIPTPVGCVLVASAEVRKASAKDAGGNIRQQCLEVKEKALNEAVKLRYQQDEAFRTKLSNSGASLFVHCDFSDTHWSVGLSRDDFIRRAIELSVDGPTLLTWMRHPEKRRDTNFGRNRYGEILTEYRNEFVMSRPENVETMQNMMSMMQQIMTNVQQQQRQAVELTRDQYQQNMSHAQIMTLAYPLGVSDQIIYLVGYMRPLSNWYPSPFVFQGEEYSSIEHYIYYHFLMQLGQPQFAHRIVESDQFRNPFSIFAIVDDFVNSQREHGVISEDELREAYIVMDSNYLKAMRAKLVHYPVLSKVLLSTGDALLIDYQPEGDYCSSFQYSETDLSKRLTRDGLTASDVLRAIQEPNDSNRPSALSMCGRDRTGILLMQLRSQIRSELEMSPMDLPTPICPVDELGVRGQYQKINPKQCEGIECFAADSPFSHLYTTSFYVGTAKYRSVQQFLCIQAAHSLKLPFQVVQNLRQLPSEKINLFLLDSIERYSPSPPLLYDWYYAEFERTLRIGLQARYQQEPEFRDLLLASGNKLLAFCGTGMTREREWTIGTSAQQLRRMFKKKECSLSGVVEWMYNGSHLRPSWLGGNRFGLVLMELRQFQLSRQHLIKDPVGTMDDETNLNDISRTVSDVVDVVVGACESNMVLPQVETTRTNDPGRKVERNVSSCSSSTLIRTETSSSLPKSIYSPELDSYSSPAQKQRNVKIQNNKIISINNNLVSPVARSSNNNSNRINKSPIKFPSPQKKKKPKPADDQFLLDARFQLDARASIVNLNSKSGAHSPISFCDGSDEIPDVVEIYTPIKNVKKRRLDPLSRKQHNLKYVDKSGGGVLDEDMEPTNSENKLYDLRQLLPPRQNNGVKRNEKKLKSKGRKNVNRNLSWQNDDYRQFLQYRKSQKSQWRGKKVSQGGSKSHDVCNTTDAVKDILEGQYSNDDDVEKQPIVKDDIHFNRSLLSIPTSSGSGSVVEPFESTSTSHLHPYNGPIGNVSSYTAMMGSYPAFQSLFGFHLSYGSASAAHQYQQQPCMPSIQPFPVAATQRPDVTETLYHASQHQQHPMGGYGM